MLRRQEGGTEEDMQRERLRWRMLRLAGRERIEGEGQRGIKEGVVKETGVRSNGGNGDVEGGERAHEEKVE